MLPVLVNTFLNVSKRIGLPTRIFLANFHLLNSPNGLNLMKSTLLQPITPTVIPSCGFKVVGKVQKRCKDCYIVAREQRLFVECKAHPRHKQMTMVKKPRNTWILTHATQSKVRPW